MKAGVFKMKLWKYAVLFAVSLSMGQNLPLLAADAPPLTSASADYVVYKEADGSNCLQEAWTGTVLERGVGASAVLQKAIDLLPSSGGKVYVAAGSYQLEKTLQIRDKHGVHIDGAARGMHAPGQGGTVFWSDKPIHLLEIYGFDRIWGVTISNLLLVGSGKDNGKAGIWAHGTTDVMTFYAVGANNCGVGFHLDGSGGRDGGGAIDAAQIFFCDPQINGVGMLIEQAHYTKIFGGEFSDCEKEGIVLRGCPRIPTQSVKILGVTAVRNGGAGIFIGKYCQDITVAGGTDLGGTRKGSGLVASAEGETGEAVPFNLILSNLNAYCNEADGVRIEQAKHVIVNATICSVHEHDSVLTAPQKAGIRILSGVEDVVVTGNITYGNLEKGIVDETGLARLTGNSSGDSSSP